MAGAAFNTRWSGVGMIKSDAKVSDCFLVSVSGSLGFFQELSEPFNASGYDALRSGAFNMHGVGKMVAEGWVMRDDMMDFFTSNEYGFGSALA